MCVSCTIMCHFIRSTWESIGLGIWKVVLVLKSEPHKHRRIMLMYNEESSFSVNIIEINSPLVLTNNEMSLETTRNKPIQFKVLFMAWFGLRMGTLLSAPCNTPIFKGKVMEFIQKLSHKTITNHPTWLLHLKFCFFKLFATPENLLQTVNFSGQL